MKYIIAGGTGFIGQALVRHWLAVGHDITVIGRDLTKIQQLFAKQVTAITWQALSTSHLAGAQAIVNLAGANIGEKRWTAARKQALIDSRVLPTHTLAKLCAQLGQAAPSLLNASGVGIYGLQAHLSPSMAYDETSAPANPEQAFLAQIGQAWEQALLPAHEAGVRTVAMRFGVVLGKEGGVLKQLRLPYQLGLGGRLGTGQQPFAWIALADLCKAIDFLLQQPAIAGPVNLVAPQAITQQQFAEAFSQQLHRPQLLALPSFIIKILFGEMGIELLLHGQQVKPVKLRDAGFTFTYPELMSALKACLR